MKTTQEPHTTRQLPSAPGHGSVRRRRGSSSIPFVLACALLAGSARAQTPVVVAGPLSRTSATAASASPITFEVSVSGATSAEVAVADVLVSATGSAAATVSTTTPFGSAMEFGSRASRPRAALFDIDVASGITLEAWVKPGDYPGAIVNYDEFPFLGYGIQLMPGNDATVMNLACRLGGQSFVTSSSPVRVGRWQHVACTADSTTVRLFVDSVEQDNFPAGPAVTYGTTEPLTVGVDQNNTPLGAPIDELRIWLVARSQAQLAAGMTVPLVGTTGLLGYWQFDAFEDLGVGPNLGGNDIPDASGNSMHLDTAPGVLLTASNALYGATVSLSNFAGNGSLALSLAAGIASDAAGNLSAAVPISPSITVTMSATAPQIVSITPDVASPTNADAITFRVVFSESVTGFAVDDLVMTLSGVGTGVSIVSSAITPIDGSNYDVLISGVAGNGSLTLGVRALAVQNSALLFNTAPANSAPVVIDNNGPNPLLSSAASSPLDGSPFVVNISFDEVVTGFAVTDLAVSNAVLGDFSGSGSSYAVTVTPADFGDVTVGPIGFGTVFDLAGNGNSEGVALSWSYPVPDTTPPAISSVIAPTFAATAAFSVEIRFTEAVIGFGLADLSFTTTQTATYGAASLTPLASHRYRLDITGAAGQGALVVEIAAGSLTDIAGNANQLLTITQQIDLVAPGVTSSTVYAGLEVTFQIVADEIIDSYDTSQMTVETTGDVGYAFKRPGLVSVNGTVLNITLSKTGNGTMALRLNPGALRDRAGNLSISSHTTAAATVDNTPPQLLSLEPLIKERQVDPRPRVVTFEGVLSEPVTNVGGGFTVDYQFLTVSPGYPTDLAPLVRVNGIPEFITPERFRVSVDIGRVPYGAEFKLWMVAQLSLRDSAGNVQAITGRRSDSPAHIDLMLTDATISTPRKVTNQSPIPINVQFTSATLAGIPANVTGFDLGDLNITNATASNLRGSGANYSFDLTPTAEGKVSLWISPDAARDADNRPNRGTEFFYIDYDISPPTILSVEALTTGNPNNDASFLVYFKVSEPLDRFSLAQAVQANLVNTGTLVSSVQPTDQTVAGFELIRISHLPGREGTVTFAVPAGAAKDLAGNATTARSALPAPIAVDLVAPTVTTTRTFVAGTNPIDPLSDSISATAVTFEFKFSEPVLDFQEGDIEISRDGPLGYGGTSFVIVSPTVGRLTLSNVVSDGVLTATLRANGVTDAVGNGNAASALSVNIDNIATEVVSITPDSLAVSSESTSFLVAWSKPVSTFDTARFTLTGFSVSKGSIAITPIDSLRSRVEVLGLTGVGEFALQILDRAARDRFNNPNFASFTSPTVKRAGLKTYGPYSVLVSGEATDIQAIGAPDLIINGVFALRGVGTGGGFVPARLTWDNRYLTLHGRFEILTSPSQALFSGTGTIDSTTGELTWVSDGTAARMSIGGYNDFAPCKARLILDNRGLRLSGGDYFGGDGFFNDVAVDPRNPANRLVLDSLSTFSLASTGCAPTGLTFQVLSFAETTRGFAFDMRTLSDLVGDATTDPALITGRIEYEDGVTPKLSGFNVRASGFDWVPFDESGIRGGTAQLLPGKLRFARLSREQAGMHFETGAMEIDSNLTTRFPDTLVVTIPCALGSLNCVTPPSGGPESRTILTMHQPVFGDRLLSSADSEPVAPGQAATLAEIAPHFSAIRLPNRHPLQPAPGLVLSVAAASIDAVAYRAPFASLPVTLDSGPGTIDYRDVAFYFDGRVSEGTTVRTPASDGLSIGGLEVIAFDVPLRITAWPAGFPETSGKVHPGYGPFDVLDPAVNVLLTLKLPTAFQIADSVKASFAYDGRLFPPPTNVLSGDKWCTPLGFKKIPIIDFQLNPFCLGFKSPPPSWSAKTFLAFPVKPLPAAPVTLTAELGIVSSKWDSVRIALAGFEIPLGSSGTYLAGVDAGLTNMAQEQTCVVFPMPFGAQFGADPTGKLCSVQPIEFRGKLDFGVGPMIVIKGFDTIRFSGAAAEAWISNARIKLEGTFYILHPKIQVSDAKAELTFAGPLFQGSTEVMTPYPGLLGSAKFTAGLVRETTPFVSGELHVSVGIPSKIPIIGGFTAASVGMGIQSDPAQMKGFFTLFAVKATVTLTTEPNLVFGKVGLPLRSWESSMVYRVDTEGMLKTSAEEGAPSYAVFSNFRSANKRYNEGGAGKAASTITIESRQPTIVRLAWANDGAIPDYTITGPGGTRFAPDTVETKPNVSAPVGFIHNAAARDASYVFSAPTPGIYVVEVGNQDALGEYAVEVLVQNEEPGFEFVNVAATGDELFLEWTATDGDDDAQISLYLDSDREDQNGRLLAGPFSEDSETSTVVDLATVTLAPGKYWVYARVDDGANAPRIIYSSEPIFIVNPDAPPAVRQIDVMAAGTTAVVKWARSADPELTRYSVKWTEDIEHDLYEENLSVQPHLNSVTVPGLKPNTTYKFTVVAVKAGSVLAARRATLRDVRDAAEGRAVSNPAGLALLGDQINRLASSMQGRQLRPSARLNAFRSGQLTPPITPLEDTTTTSFVESLVAEFDIIETTALAGQNNVPEFLSDPDRTVMSSGVYQYEAKLADRDGDTPSLRLVEGPEGMTLAGRKLSWTPGGKQGTFEVILEASDGVATRNQEWTLTSSGLFADDLRLAAQDVGNVTPGVPFAFEVKTQGGCGSLISYRLLTAPAGMTVNGAGLVEWMPPSTGGDDVQFVVAASQLCSGNVTEASRQYVVDVEAAGADTGTFVPLPPTCPDGPTATVSELTDGREPGTVDIRVDLTGTAPWSIFWLDGEVTQNIQTSPAVRTVSGRRDITAPGTRTLDYSLAAVADARCNGTVSGVVSVSALGPDVLPAFPTKP